MSDFQGSNYFYLLLFIYSTRLTFNVPPITKLDWEIYGGHSMSLLLMELNVKYMGDLMPCLLMK